PSNAANKIVIGLYANTASNKPGALLTAGTITQPTAGGWNSVAVTSVHVTAGTSYWIAVLGPTGGGTFQFVDSGASRVSFGSTQTSLSTLPGTYSPGPAWNSASVCATATGKPD